MPGHRFARPERACLTCRVVADREDEIERRRTRCCKLGPRLRTQVSGRVSEPLQEFEGPRVNPALRLRAPAVSLEPAVARLVKNGLGQHRTCGVACAEEEHVVELV